MLEYAVIGGAALLSGRFVSRMVNSLYGPLIKGFFGEAKVKGKLNKFKSPDNAKLHNLLLPYGRGTSQVDHALITRHGIFVIETKNYSTLILGAANEQQWYQKYSNGDKRPFLNPLIQNAAHVRAIRRLLSKYPNLPIYSLVVFSNKAKLPPVANIVNMSNLRGAIKTRCIGDPLLTADEVEDIENTISKANIRGRAARRQHNSRAQLAALTARTDHSADIQRMFDEANKAPMLLFTPEDTLKEPSPEYLKLTDNGAVLTIGKRTASISDFFEDAKRNTSGYIVPPGADFDHFVCPYTGDSFPKSEAKSFYQGLWISYLNKNPNLVEHMQMEGPENFGSTHRTQKVLSSYCSNKESFVKEARSSSWYKNLETKLSRKKKDLSEQINEAKSKQNTPRQNFSKKDIERD